MKTQKIEKKKEMSGFKVISSVALSLSILTAIHYLFFAFTFLEYFLYHIILSLFFMLIILKSKKKLTKKLKNIKNKMETNKTEVIVIKSRIKTFKEQLATQKRVEIVIDNL